MDNSQFVTATLSEFFSVWNSGGDASLNLTTSSSFIDISFNLRLGQPGSLFSNSSSSTPPTVGRHRGQAQKKRDRQRAARHQATKADQTSSTTTPVIASTTNSEPVIIVSEPVTLVSAPDCTASVQDVPVGIAPVTSTVTQVNLPAPEVKLHKCEYCGLTFNTNKGMGIHKGRMHQDIVSQTEPVKASTSFKCDHCDFRSENKGSLEHHIETIHRELQCQYCDFKVISISSMNAHIQIAHNYIQPTPSDFSSSTPPAAKLPVYVPGTTYSSAEYSCPGNAPPPPPCEKCGSQTWWICSRVKQDMGWLHEFFCHCLTRKCISTPPVI